MKPERAGVLALLLFSGVTQAQISAQDPDWAESQVPPPPVIRTDRLIELEMPRYLTARFGIDPDSIRLTPDGVVRYVVVAKAPAGPIQASYEGIRCLTGEFKVYARSLSDGQWQAVSNPAWRALNSNQPSPHALAMARQGACDGRSAAEPSAEAIVRRLRAGQHQGNLR